MEKILVAGHRGSCGEYAENTLVSFQAALDFGVDMIETDIHMTRDKELVIFHDHKVDRTTDGTGYVRDLDLSYIKTLDSGKFKDARFTGQKVLAFTEFLEFVQPYNELQFNFELKDYPHHSGDAFSHESADRAIELIRQYNLENRCVITSFSGKILEYVDSRYEHSFKLQGFYPYSKLEGYDGNPNDYLYSACICDDTPCPRREYFEYILSHGIKAWMPVSIIKPEDFEKAVKLGAKLFTSDWPKDALRKLTELGLR